MALSEKGAEAHFMQTLVDLKSDPRPGDRAGLEANCRAKIEELLMADLFPFDTKRAAGCDISGLCTYGQ